MVMRTPIHKACHALCWGDDAHPVSHGRVLRQDGDAPLLLQCVGVHDALLHDLIRPEYLRARRVLLSLSPRARDSARLLAIQKNHSASRAPAAAVRRAGGKPAPRSRQARLAWPPGTGEGSAGARGHLALLQHGVHERGLAVVDVRNDGDVADVLPH